MNDFPVVRQPILPVRHLQGGSYHYLPSYLFNFMRVSAGRVEIDTYNLRDYLVRPNELLNDLNGAYEECEKMRAGSMNVRHSDAPFDYWFTVGHKYPLSNGRWHKENHSDDYLTVTTRDYTTERWDYVGNTVYIKLEVHERLLNELRINILGTIGQHIEKGIDKAIKQNTATVDQIQDERKRLEHRIEELKREEQKAIEREAARVAKQPTPRSLAGYVYVLKEVHGTHYKIGHTAHPEKRKHTFDVKLPFAVEFDVLIATDDRFTLERELHTRYDDKRVSGEWFALNDDDLDYLRTLAETH